MRRRRFSTNASIKGAGPITYFFVADDTAPSDNHDTYKQMGVGHHE